MTLHINKCHVCALGTLIDFGENPNTVFGCCVVMCFCDRLYVEVAVLVQTSSKASCRLYQALRHHRSRRSGLLCSST